MHYWMRIERHLHRSLDFLCNVNASPRYLTWWQLSDSDPEVTKKCEVLAKILCHSSILKGDDLRLKSQLRYHKLCTLYIMYSETNASNVYSAYINKLIYISTNVLCILIFTGL